GEIDDPYTSDGKLLTIYQPLTDKTNQFIDVKEYHLSDSGNYIAFVTHEKKAKDEVYKLDIRHFTNPLKQHYFAAFTAIGSMAWNSTESKFAFLASKDTVKINKHFELYLIDLETESPEIIIID